MLEVDIAKTTWGPAERANPLLDCFITVALGTRRGGSQFAARIPPRRVSMRSSRGINAGLLASLAQKAYGHMTGIP